MEITGYNPISNISLSAPGNRSEITEQTDPSNTEAAEEIQNPGVAVDEENPDINIGTDSKPRGVIRLLQAGHFKGVADVRLRINFHEEITALEQAQAARVAEEGISSLMDSINGEIGGFLQTAEIDEETAAAVSEAAEILNASFSEMSENLGADYAGANNLISSLQAGYDDFISTVNAGAVEQPEEDTGETEKIITTQENEIVPAENNEISDPEEEPPAEEPLSPLEQFLAGLTENFSAGLDELQMSLMEVNVLPELSEPNGNGKAYEKFVSIYNALTEPETESVPSSLEDITA
jgi:hypothetical protein